VFELGDGTRSEQAQANAVAPRYEGVAAGCVDRPLTRIKTR